MSETPETNPGYWLSVAPGAGRPQPAVAHCRTDTRSDLSRTLYRILCVHPQAFVKAVSRWYPCSDAMIVRYPDQWNLKYS